MTAETMVGFGRKQAWLAIRGRDAGAVVDALGLRDLGPAPWREGVDLAHLTDDRLAITPPLPGARDGNWILVAGRRLFTIPSTVEAVALSVALATEVQFFATHRVGEQHRWVRAVDGVLVRAFDFVGETGHVTEWRGDPDDAERSLGIPEAASDADDLLVGEDDVARLAGRWSIDPTSLDGRPSPGPLHVAAAPD
ncbi:hypothetical protein [Asanoa sp. NPDC050611]|uniref:hypothetical protein n=1 Tax=Asanoa sp. NPDC050611 TaxID=3157098 RepID=UPI0034008DD9